MIGLILIAVFAGSIVFAAVTLSAISKRVPPAADYYACPPEWKCNGSPATNDPGCCL